MSKKYWLWGMLIIMVAVAVLSYWYIRSLGTGPENFPFAYENSEYGFQLILNNAWRNYQVVKKPAEGLNGTYYFYFQVPIKDTSYGDGSGYASPLGIGVYPKDTWLQICEEPGPPDCDLYLGKNELYFFDYRPWQDPPPELMNIDFKVSEVLGTFKFLK